MSDSSSKIQALEAIILSSEKLEGLSMPSECVEGITDAAMSIVLRGRLGKNRPSMAGFIGCTGSGKSTIFNSLCGQAVCITGWKAHNTAGPVMLLSDRFKCVLEELERDFAPLFLPRWKRECSALSDTKSETGTPGAIHWILSSEPAWNKTVLFDLPDINTTRSRSDNLLAFALIPWLDVVAFVVDEETLYHRDYEEPVALSKSLRQRRICILNNRGKDRIELDHPDFQGVREFFGVDTIHVLPDLGDKQHFDSEPAFQRFRDDLLLTEAHAPNRPLEDRIAPFAQTIVRENERRRSTLVELEERAERVIHERLASEKPLPIHRILNNDAIQVLEHLGLKRFSVSNLLHFFKRVATTGALKRSFIMSFGNQRDETVSNLLRLDGDKLKDEIAARLSDHREAIRHALLSHPDARLYSEALSPIPKPDEETAPHSTALKEAMERFEEECRSLIASDTLSSSIKNDPLVAVGILVALIADVLTIPGFGSWLVIPSIFKFIPLGKFQKTKHAFQQRIRDVVRETLMEDIHQLQTIRRSLTLDEPDSLLKALRTVAGNDEN